MRKAIFILSLAILAFGCGSNPGTNSGGGGSQAQPTFTGKLECGNRATSPKGVTVCSSSPIAASTLAAIDAQLDELFKIAGNGQTTASGVNNYKPCADGKYEGSGTCYSTHSTYHVWVIDRGPQCESPGFTELVESGKWPDGYDNDPNGWDKDPTPGRTLLCVAGFMATGGGQMKGLELPGMGVVDAIDQMPIIRYEGEHNLLAQADNPRFAATQFHYGANGGHPILGDSPAPAQLKGSRPAVKITEQPFKIQDGEGHNLIVTK